MVKRKKVKSHFGIRQCFKLQLDLPACQPLSPFTHPNYGEVSTSPLEQWPLSVSNMPFKSPHSVPIPTTSVPTLVFGSPTATLPDTPLLLSTTPSPHHPSLTLSSYRYLSQCFAAGLLHSVPEFRPGDRVMLISPNSVYMPVVFMGTIMAGGIFGA